MLKRALKAGSTLPPLARSTAFTTAASIEGKASLRVFSANCWGDNGRGGLGGAISSPEPSCGVAEVASLFVGGDDGESAASSSKSSAFAVVGDSARAPGF